MCARQGGREGYKPDFLHLLLIKCRNSVLIKLNAKSLVSKQSQLPSTPKPIDLFFLTEIFSTTQHMNGLSTKPKVK